MSKVLSIIPAAFSNCMEYEKPEHPPPTTPMRRPAGTGVCCPIMSFTLAMALAVRFTGAFFGATSGLVTSGMVVVAILVSLAWKSSQTHYSKCFFALLVQPEPGSGVTLKHHYPGTVRHYETSAPDLMRPDGDRSLSRPIVGSARFLVSPKQISC